MIQQLIYKKLHYIIFIFFLLVAAVDLILTLPKPDQYFFAADEGIYYRQASTIKEQGISGFSQLADSYIKDSQQQIFPPPYRIGHIIPLSLLLKLNDSISMLSYYSICSFLIFSIISFFFLMRHWDRKVAVVGSILLLSSPLLNGMARHALSESDFNLCAIGTLICLIDLIVCNRRSSLILFITFMTISILVKETALFFIPFYLGALVYYKFVEQRNITFHQLLSVAILPPLIALAILAISFGSLVNIYQIFEIQRQINTINQHQFIIDYNSGPWFSYFIDYFLLMPFISILFFLYIGYYLLNNQRSLVVNLLLGYLNYFFIIFSFLAKNVRYGITLNFVYVVLASLMVIELAQRYFKSEIKRYLAISIVTLLLAFTGWKAYHHYFVNYVVYDPISYRLFKSARMIPNR